ncbi:MAG: bifunctional phosphopantothenoylcysteine decarboxylase/phosphopantothenate--cysteine ligase CoaBC [Nitrospiraceae bacterium]|nr:bifunctional phosphopantothenoylcysteine decarboxylase/phosphopantothenate--cysteine ligase CoaBC [Nitrospiraceae bacterium]
MKDKTKLLKNKKILLGVTGGAAAYKAVELTRRLKDEGASVTVVMTDASKYFVTPLSLEIASENSVFSDLFGDPMSHISLSRDADVMVIAPATADIIGKFANGIAADLLSTCFLSFKGKIIIAPSMNWRMYEHPIFKENLNRLLALGVIQIGPEKGTLACGEDGIGRMSEVCEIIDAIKSSLSNKDLSKKKVIVTAGPTREYLDPVRYISNRSSGRMGYALAIASMRRGAEVILISGPSSLKTPRGLKSFVPVETAAAMKNAVFSNLKDADMVIMAAAPADFFPEKTHAKKIEKSDVLDIKLKKNPDILTELGQLKRRPVLVGFAAETGERLDRARKKLVEKNVDIIIFNDVTSSGAGFDVDTNRITIVERNNETALPLMTKEDASEEILNAALKHL